MKETGYKRDKITELVWSMSKRYTVKEYKGNLDCTQYLTVDEVFEIVNSVKEECTKGILIDLKTIVALSRTVKVDIYPKEIENIINKHQIHKR